MAIEIVLLVSIYCVVLEKREKGVPLYWIAHLNEFFIAGVFNTLPFTFRSFYFLYIAQWSFREKLTAAFEQTQV